MMKLRNLYAYAGVAAVGASQFLSLGVARADTSNFDANSSSVSVNGTTDFSSSTSANLKDNLASIGSSTVGIITLVAGILAVVYLIWSGVQYITAGGNPEKTKAARAGIINAIIGLVVIVAAYFIVRLALSAGNTVANSTGG